MKAEDCRDWRLSLGAYVLGQLPTDERAGLEAHLEGCPTCRAEAESLGSVAGLLPLADPSQFERPAPSPSPALGTRIAAMIGRELRAERRRQRQRRFGLALAGASAVAAAAVVAIAILPGSGGSGEPELAVHFPSLPKGVEIDATLEPHAFGTQIRMQVHGMRSGILCRVFLRGPDGLLVPAGTFRYRWGDDSSAVLSSALDLSRTRAITVHAGNRTFIAPVDAAGATAGNNKTREA